MPDDPKTLNPAARSDAAAHSQPSKTIKIAAGAAIGSAAIAAAVLFASKLNKGPADAPTTSVPKASKR